MEVSSLSLRETLGPVSFVSAGDVVASSFCCDSRNLRPGEVFVAVPGKSHDGHGFIEAAVSAGASAVYSAWVDAGKPALPTAGERTPARIRR